MQLDQLRQVPLLRVDRRKEPRMFVDKTVIVSWADAQRVGVATVLDWSQHGLRIRHRLSLQKNDIAMVITPECRLKTRVVWRAESEEGCEAGLLIVDPSDPEFFDL